MFGSQTKGQRAKGMDANFIETPYRFFTAKTDHERIDALFSAADDPDTPNHLASEYLLVARDIERNHMDNERVSR